MAKRSELEAFADHHDIKIGTIADLIQYRTLYDKTIELKDTQRIKTAAGWFDLKTYTDKVSECVHFALIKGQIDESKPCLVRVQVLNTLRDIFLAERPDKKPSWSLLESMEKIVRSGTGAVVIVGQQPSQEELLSQIRYFPEIPPIQRQSNELGEYRLIGTGSQILRDIGVGKMRLLSSPTRFNAISGFQLEVVEFLEKT